MNLVKDPVYGRRCAACGGRPFTHANGEYRCGCDRAETDPTEEEIAEQCGALRGIHIDDPHADDDEITRRLALPDGQEHGPASHVISLADLADAESMSQENIYVQTDEHQAGPAYSKHLSMRQEQERGGRGRRGRNL
jgi:hypothetical protein